MYDELLFMFEYKYRMIDSLFVRINKRDITITRVVFVDKTWYGGENVGSSMFYKISNIE